jgi:hypothetical protein
MTFPTAISNPINRWRESRVAPVASREDGPVQRLFGDQCRGSQAHLCGRVFWETWLAHRDTNQRDREAADLAAKARGAAWSIPGGQMRDAVRQKPRGT